MAVLCARVSVRFLANPFSGRTISNADTHTHILHSCGQSADAAASAQTRAPGLCARSELCSLVFGRRYFFCVGLVAGACVPDRVHAECNRNAHTHTLTQTIVSFVRPSPSHYYNDDCAKYRRANTNSNRKVSACAPG